MYEMTLVALCVCVAACASGSGGADAPPSLPTGSSGGQRDLGQHVVTATPRTIDVELDDETRQGLEQHLAAGSLTVARLQLRDVRPQSAQALKGVRIFIEKPDADARTPVDDPHYAGTIVIGFTASESVLLNVAPTLARLRQSADLTTARLAERKAIRITLVSEPWDFAARLPADFALTIQGVTLTVPREQGGPR
jgi:hypothetical protein